MSTPRVMWPILGASSRLLLEQCVQVVPGASASARTVAAPGRLVPWSNASTTTRLSLSRGLFTTRQLRFHPTDRPEPPKSPDDDAPSSEPSKAPGYDAPSSEPFRGPGYDMPNFEPPKDPHDNAASSDPPKDLGPDAPHPEAASESPSNPESPSSPSPIQQAAESNPDLPSRSEAQRSALSQGFSSFMDRAQTTAFAASQRLNDLTGYSGIETLKSQIASLEAALSAAQAQLLAARSNYKSKVAERSATQREVTTLLARQKTWTPLDFERFTSLYRQDYELEAGVAEAARDLEEAERDAERLGRDLSTGILARYHEEQIWSDKIRRMSTWGTWGLMGVNVLLFLVFQFGAEPWRRARLVRGFEEKVGEALARERELERQRREEKERAREAAAPAVLVDAVGGEQAGADAVMAEPSAAAVVEEATALVVEDKVPVMEDKPPALSWRETLRETLNDPRQVQAVVADLARDRPVAVRMRDLSIIALEGVVGGAAVAGAIAVLLLRRT